MAVSSVALDIRANTSRALNEFKKFSSQLDNKFLISGLKLDVVRSALGQINREFQKAIGEQGLAAGASMRAAENQAALLTQTFKSFSQEASLDMSTRFSDTINQVAINIGSTTEDIKKTLNATPWISTNLSKSLSDELTRGMAIFQTQARRAGFTSNYAEIIQQFLMNQITPEELINSGNSLKSRIGLELAKVVGIGGTPSSEARSRAVLELQRNANFASTLKEMEARADWGKSVLEQLNSKLFNPQAGVFGVLREITMSVGDKTTLLTETKSLIESVFGAQGFFVRFFKEIGKIFGIEDPLKVVIAGVRWITKQFNRLTNFLDSPEVKGISALAQNAIGGTITFFTGIYNTVTRFFTSEDGQRITDKAKEAFDAVFTLESTMGGIIGAILGSVVPGVGTLAGAGLGGSIGALSSSMKGGALESAKINKQIDGLGESVRTFIENVGKGFREADFSKEGNFFMSIFKNLVGEIFKTLGVAIKELIATLFSSKGAAAIGAVGSTISTAISEFFKGLLGNGPGSIVGGIATAGIGVIFARRFLGVLVGALRPIAMEITRILGGGGGAGGLISRVLGFGPRDPLRGRIGQMALGARAGVATQGVGSMARRGAGFINALPPWAKAVILAGTAATAFFGTNRSAKSAEMGEEQGGEGGSRVALRIGAGLVGGLAGGKAGAGAGAALGSFLGPKGTLVGGAIGGILGSIVGGILGEEAVKKISDPVLNGVGQFANKISNFFTKTLPSNFSSAVGDISEGVIGFRNNIQTSFTNSLESLKSFDFGAFIRNAIIAKVEELKNTGNQLGKIGSDISAKAQEMFSQAVTNFSRVIEGFKNWFSNLPGVRGIIGLLGGDRANAQLPNISSENVPILARSVSSGVMPVSNVGFANDRSVSASFYIPITVGGVMDATTLNVLEERLMAVLDKGWKDITAGTVDRGTTTI